MKNKPILISFILILMAASLAGIMDAWAATNSSTNYFIFADAFTAGGSEHSSSTSFGIQDSVAEAIISSIANSTSSATNYGIKSGFRELYQDQFLTLSIPDNSVNLGTLNNSQATTDSNTIIVETNATWGFSMTATGDKATLASAEDSITAIGPVAAASAPGTKQFGINLVANTSPSVGANPSGVAQLGSAADQYNTANLFAWNSGDVVATSSHPINATTFTVSYMANITTVTEPGSYSLTITYAATGNF